MKMKFNLKTSALVAVVSVAGAARLRTTEMGSKRSVSSGGSTSASSSSCVSSDWLVCPSATPVGVTDWTQGSLSGITMSNGLVERSWITSASGVSTFALWDYRSLLDGMPLSLVRTLNQEATVTLAMSSNLANTTDLTVGGVTVAARPGPSNFTQIASNSASECTFVAQGPTDSLQSCLDACWGSACNIVNWIAGSAADSSLSSSGDEPASAAKSNRDGAAIKSTASADCVLKACPGNAIQNPDLSPLNGCDVYATSSPLPQSLINVNSCPYLNRTGLTAAGMLAPIPSPLVFQTWSTGAPVARFNWTAGRRPGPPSNVQWPPNGLTLTATFAVTDASSPWYGVQVNVHYEMYVGSPAFSKWVTVSMPASTASASAALVDASSSADEETSAAVAASTSTVAGKSSAGASASGIVLQGVEVEHLGLNPSFSPMAPITYNQFYNPGDVPPLYPSSSKFHVFVDYHYAGWVNWTNQDPNENTPGAAQPLLTVTELPGLMYPLYAGGRQWTSLRAYELIFDDGPESGIAVPRYPASETYFGCTLGPCTPYTGSAMLGGMTERWGLTIRRFLALISPQGFENPLQNHLFVGNDQSIRDTCDEMQLVGWEMLVLTGGSGFDIESYNATYRAEFATDVQYCNARGIEVGGYDLIGWTRDPGNGWSTLNPDGSDSGDACFASGWEEYLSNAFFSFANSTGITVVETDGPYAGYSCSNASHAGHSGESNSVAIQTRNMADLYSALQSKGYYINAPDSYFPFGISKQGIGYNEGTFRLADVDVISLIQRQVVYDATYYTYPSMAWSQIPMQTYDYTSSFGLNQFEQGVAGQMVMGIGTFINQQPGGPFLPVPGVQSILSMWATWFKQYRVLLSAGVLIHVARPDGQGLDIILHALATEVIPGLLIITNPTPDPITVQNLLVPLYYTGLQPGSSATIAWQGSQMVNVTLDWRARARFTDGVTVPGRSIQWATVAAA